MENKYYTPEIEEFHHGFEYEWRLIGPIDIWNSGTFNVNDGDTDCQAGQFYDNHPNSPNSVFRVKYLDRKDIESLGWLYSGTVNNLTIPPTPVAFLFKLNKFKLEFEFEALKNNNYLFISTHGDTFVFQGKIKNKSELKRLMKQLGI